MHDRMRIVHGDIRPDNIIVGANPLNFVLTDFGNAWTEERAANRVAGDGFHPGYAAPEMSDPTCTPTDLSDQFSATVVLFELLAHRLPFEELGGKAGLPQFREKFRGYLPSVRAAIEERGDLPRHLIQQVEKLVATGLSLNSEKRFPTGAAWRDAVDLVSHRIQPGPRINGWSEFWISLIGSVGRKWQRPSK